MIHAHTMRPAIPHRTALIRLVALTPMIAPVIVCVVLTGIPLNVARVIVSAPAVSAALPPTGRSLVMRLHHRVHDAPPAKEQSSNAMAL